VTNNYLVWVRGAGELASATALTLFRTGFKVIVSELEKPFAIRRTVTFSDAILNGKSKVEDVEAVYCKNAEEIESLFKESKIALLKDDPEEILKAKPDIIVDARMLKREVPDLRKYASIGIGFGPGFNAGKNCDALIETKRGHDLGKIIWSGEAIKNTGVPGNIGGESKKRVLYSPCFGKLEWQVQFGDIVETDQVIGTIEDQKVKAPFRGMVRGLISPDTDICQGLKIADVDPRGEGIDYMSISDKSRLVARGVLEVIITKIAQNEM